MYMLRFVTFEIQFAKRQVFKKIQNIRRIVQHVLYEIIPSKTSFDSSFLFFRLKNDDLNFYSGLKIISFRIFSSDFF